MFIVIKTQFYQLKLFLLMCLLGYDAQLDTFIHQTNKKNVTKVITYTRKRLSGETNMLAVFFLIFIEKPQRIMV